LGHLAVQFAKLALLLIVLQGGSRREKAFRLLSV